MTDLIVVPEGKILAGKLLAGKAWAEKVLAGKSPAGQVLAGEFLAGQILLPNLLAGADKTLDLVLNKMQIFNEILTETWNDTSTKVLARLENILAKWDLPAFLRNSTGRPARPRRSCHRGKRYCRDADLRLIADPSDFSRVTPHSSGQRQG